MKKIFMFLMAVVSFAACSNNHKTDEKIHELLEDVRAYHSDLNAYTCICLQADTKEVAIYLLKAEIRQNIERKEVVKKTITNDGKETKKIQAKSKKKVGRNDPCPCGSGKKYKQCHGK